MDFLKTAFREFSNDRCTQMAASLAFYTMLSLVPLLVVTVTIASLVVGPEAQRSFIQQAQSVVGPAGAEELQEMLNRGQEQAPVGVQAEEPAAVAERAPQQADSSGWSVPTIVMNAISVLVLIFSATGVVAQLQTSLNQVWEVEPDTEQVGWFGFVKKRLLSLAMILGIAFLLLVSMLLTTVLTSFGAWISDVIGVGVAVRFMISEGTTFLLVTVLFAAMFKVLPDARVPWKVTWVGAAMTALLFTVGKFLIGLYLGSKDMSSTYGQAGSLVLILLWAYYSSIIFFFGAEMTEVWARRHGHAIEPSAGAVRVVERRERVDGHDKNGAGERARSEKSQSEPQRT